jgi:hypothetical protein
LKKTNNFHPAVRRYGDLPMKHSRLFLIGFSMILAVSCIINTGAIGGTSSGGLVADPAKGLDQLSHYRADLTIATKAQASGGPIEYMRKYSLAVWTAEKAIFQTVDSLDAAGQPIQFALGTVGQAGYALLGGDTGCRTFWNDTNIHVDADSLAPYLVAIKSGTSAGDDTVNGIAVRKYSVNSNSIGVKGVEATGTVWIASSGGYLVKYHVEFSGGQALFGTDVTGTQTIDYELSEVNSGAPVAYPGDCRPVLTDIPATDDAQNLGRMPNRLWFVSASTPDRVQSFYEDYFSGQGWVKVNEAVLPSGEKDILFSQDSTKREAVVALRSEGNTTVVNVLTTDGPETPSADQTPGGSENLPPSALIIVSLSKLFGIGTTPSVLPSFALVVDEVMPTVTGTAVTNVQAEIEGTNVHYVLTSGGETTNAILFEGKEYLVVDGKAQPGEAMLSATWSLWQLDLLGILGAAGMADPQVEAGTTWEGRAVDVYSVDNTSLGGEGQDSSFGVLPVSITSIHGTVWIDHATGALLKADLEFEGDVRKPGESTPTAHGKGELHLSVSQIGKTTVSLPQ